MLMVQVDEASRSAGDEGLPGLLPYREVDLIIPRIHPDVFFPTTCLSPPKPVPQVLDMRCEKRGEAGNVNLGIVWPSADWLED